jgi:hypothetical protein
MTGVISMTETLPPQLPESELPGAQLPPGSVVTGEPLLLEDPPAPSVGSFLREPWVQNVLPLATSLTFHIALIIIGIAAYKTVQRMVEVVQEQIIIPESTMADSGPPGGIPHAGPGADPTRDAALDLNQLTADSQSWSTKASDNLNQAALGGAESDASAMIAVGAKSSSGKTPGDDPQIDANSTGQLAPFGVPGGGAGAGPKSSFLGVGGNAHKVVYLCAASGAMLSVFDALKLELRRSIDALKPVQSFDIIFFNEDGTRAFDANSLVPASPDNKRKAYAFIDTIVTHGDANAIPAIQLAMALKPELIYSLTNGFYKVPSFDAVIKAFSDGNTEKKTHINCLYLQSDPDPKLVQVLKQIAKENGGVMRTIGRSDF